MRIKDVESLTGLTRKSIRFYEAKGLLRVKRSDNSYREYDESVVRQLQSIAALRKAGVSISDIQLWQDEVISLEEMLRKRLSELKDHSELTASQTALCQDLIHHPGHLCGQTVSQTPPLDEAEALQQSAPDARLCLGVDIGTTTISSVVLDLSAGCSVAAYTVKGSADIPSPHSWEKLQDVRKIEDRVTKLIDSLLDRYPQIQAIGFTGQMHGILYLDSQNRPCSPLYTWQDGRAGLGKPSTCQILAETTGFPVPAGYGLATHCHLQRTGELPQEAVRLCTVMDYLAWKLCGFCHLRIHSTNAASLGFFDLKARRFDTAALEKAGISPDFLPEVTSENEILGTYRGIPVSVAIGDNQASFLGTVRDHASMPLANFGTGSQISLFANENMIHSFTPDADIEIRPFLENTFLISGSALCGGRAYALLEQFFRSFASSIGKDGEQYEVLNRLALKGLEEESPMDVSTTFCGTRQNPELRGYIGNIGEDNFTPEALAAGILSGMARELKQMHQRMPSQAAAWLVASGNAIRKNPALRKALEQVFQTEVLIPAHQEEAAYGAAMFCAMAAKLSPSDEISQNCIRYIGR